METKIRLKNIRFQTDSGKDISFGRKIIRKAGKDSGMVYVTMTQNIQILFQPDITRTAVNVLLIKAKLGKIPEKLLPMKQENFRDSIKDLSLINPMFRPTNNSGTVSLFL